MRVSPTVCSILAAGLASGALRVGAPWASATDGRTTATATTTSVRMSYLTPVATKGSCYRHRRDRAGDRGTLRNRQAARGRRDGGGLSGAPDLDGPHGRAQADPPAHR